MDRDRETLRDAQCLQDPKRCVGVPRRPPESRPAATWARHLNYGPATLAANFQTSSPTSPRGSIPRMAAACRWRLEHSRHECAHQLNQAGRCRKAIAACSSDAHGPKGRGQAGLSVLHRNSRNRRSYLSSGPELGVKAHTEAGEMFGMGQSELSPWTSVSIRAGHAPQGSTLRPLSASSGKGGARLTREAGLKGDANRIDQADFCRITFLIAEVGDASRQTLRLEQSNRIEQ